MNKINDAESPPLSVAPLLKELVGTRVTSLVRRSVDPREEVPGECECAKHDFFRWQLAPSPWASRTARSWK